MFQRSIVIVIGPTPPGTGVFGRPLALEPDVEELLERLFGKRKMNRI